MEIFMNELIVSFTERIIVGYVLIKSFVISFKKLNKTVFKFEDFVLYLSRS